MQFQVPQYIEVEDKIIGPLTLKQFLYLAAGGGILFMLWFLVELWLFIIMAIIIGFICAALAFYKVNGRPLIAFLGSIMTYFKKPKLYIWKK
jgi:hypothetical protein